MRYTNHKQHRCALTLVELLLVITVIGILASLLLGAGYKARAYAKNQAWRAEAHRDALGHIQDRLSTYYRARKNYPILTAKELHQLGVFDDRIMDFLECPHVQFTPFSQGDPDDKIILFIPDDWLFNDKSYSSNAGAAILKKEVTKPE